MKKSLFILALGLSTAINAAYADTYSATLSGDGYQFSNSFSGTTSFDDYVSFSTEGLQNIIASVSGTGGSAFSFTTFNLLDADKNLITTGSITNLTARISVGGLESYQQSGNFFLHVIGSSTGTTAGYNGTILTTAVPEPETYSLTLSGLMLIGVLARRKIAKKAN